MIYEGITSTVKREEINEMLKDFLLDNEEIEIAFEDIHHGFFCFTNYRIVFKESEVRFCTIPYNAVGTIIIDDSKLKKLRLFLAGWYAPLEIVFPADCDISGMQKVLMSRIISTSAAVTAARAA